MTAAEIADQFAEKGFEGFEEIEIPQMMVGGTREAPEFANQWTTFYDAHKEGDRVVFEIGEGVVWSCPASQEVAAR